MASASLPWAETRLSPKTLPQAVNPRSNSALLALQGFPYTTQVQSAAVKASPPLTAADIILPGVSLPCPLPCPRELRGLKRAEKNNSEQHKLEASLPHQPCVEGDSKQVSYRGGEEPLLQHSLGHHTKPLSLPSEGMGRAAMGRNLPICDPLMTGMKLPHPWPMEKPRIEEVRWHQETRVPCLLWLSYIW